MSQANSYFKYRPLYHTRADGTREPHPFTKAIFEKSEIYYAAPKDFNDPFDCDMRLHTDGTTDSEWEGHFKLMLLEQPEFRQHIEFVIKNKLWKSEPIVKEQFGRAEYNRIRDNSSVFCLSRKGNSIPMFSYYADGHRGIAIQFSFREQETPCGYLIEKLLSRDRPYGDITVAFSDVEYRESFPELNYFRLRGTTKLTENLFFKKHKDWEHEEEYRIFRHNVSAGNVAFDKKLLVRVVFGCKTNHQDMDLVKGWLQGWHSDVVLAKVTQVTDRFELKIDDVETVKATV
jgi:hypothetical protein